MKKIGITGGIGSGKSIVCQVFQTLGCKIYSADESAKKLIDSNSEIKKAVIHSFGEDIFKLGRLDRKLMAGIVFNNPEALEKLNAIIHPFVFEDFNQWVESNKNEPYIIKEAAIMFETGANKLLDSVVLVHSPMEIRLKRVIERDRVDKEAVMARIENQMTDEEKMKLSDFIIYNDEEHSLIKQVLTLDILFKR